jgi:hypothetical protein
VPAMLLPKSPNDYPMLFQEVMDISRLRLTQKEQVIAQLKKEMFR